MKSTWHRSCFATVDRHVRVNHYQSINENGIVSYSLNTKPKRDEKHEIELKLESDHEVISFSICWNNVWRASVTMSNDNFTIGPYIDPNEK